MLTLEELTKSISDNKYIYHYTSARTAIEFILFNKNLLLNTLYKTHDPLEFEDYMARLEQGEPYTAERLLEVADMLSEQNRILKGSTKIACFSADFNSSSDLYSVFKKGYCRSRMWSQFADAHRGLCLIFDREALLGRIKDQIGSKKGKGHGNIYLEADYINYDNSLPGLTELLSTDPSILNEISMMEYIEGNIKTYLFQKLKDYEHEQEFRISLYSDSFNPMQNFYIDYGNSLQGIILGCRFFKQYEINIMNYSKDQVLPVFQMLWENGYPRIFKIHENKEKGAWGLL